MNPSGERFLETPLTGWHVANGGKMVPFAGFTMPVQYSAGVLAEHAAVRERVGIFDITHMGEIVVKGDGAEGWLDGLVTNKVADLPVGKIVYTPMCNDRGGVLDDMLIYRLGKQKWLVVCNAVNRAKIVAWLTGRRPAAGVKLEDVSEKTALIAVQGPLAADLVASGPTLRDFARDIADLEFYEGKVLPVNEEEWIVSRTGYTGERGYEVYLPNGSALHFWKELLAAGADQEVVPVGLAARDTLRFEMCYCLYGHELDEDISPLEAGIQWAVKFKKGGFVGREVLIRQKGEGPPRKLIALKVDGRAIARQGAVVSDGGSAVGRVTSGNFSPTLRQPLALALVEAGTETRELAVEVRGKQIACRGVPIPFLPARVKGDPRAPRDLPGWAGFQQEA